VDAEDNKQPVVDTSDIVQELAEMLFASVAVPWINVYAGDTLVKAVIACETVDRVIKPGQLRKRFDRGTRPKASPVY
jgi:hypothetical protein